MGLKERMRARLESLRGQVKLLTELLAEEDDTPVKTRTYKKRAKKPSKKKPKDAKLPEVKRTPLLGEVPDPEEQLDAIKKRPKSDFDREELLLVLSKMPKGATSKELLVAINAERDRSRAVALSQIHTMVSHLIKEPQVKGLTRKKTPKHLDARRSYRYFYKPKK